MSVQLLQSTDDVNEARADIFGALSDPTRLRIFQTLLEAENPLTVTELCERTDLKTNLVSHHLQCLKNCQLVDAEKDGRKRYYEVSRPEAAEMVELADDCIRQNIETVLGCEIVETTSETDG
jgi:DNA-binding transcriptional ArsR family regulator